MEPKIDVCPHCGAKRKWDVWVIAHWDLRLTGKCDTCNNKYSIQSGEVVSPRKNRRGAQNGPVSRRPVCL